MSAAKYNIQIESGSDFALQLVWQDEQGSPVDLSGYSAFAQVRDCKNKLLAQASTTAGSITLDTAGLINIHIKGSETIGINATGEWDLLMVSEDDSRTRLLEGKAKFDKGITQL